MNELSLNDYHAVLSVSCCNSIQCRPCWAPPCSAQSMFFFCNRTIFWTCFLLFFYQLLMIDIIWEVTLTSPPLSIIVTGNSRKSLERGRPLTHWSGTIVILHDIDMKLIILVCCLLGLSLANEEGDDLQVASTEVCIIFALNLASNQW